jgi:outer membrane lipoprotein LolB
VTLQARARQVRVPGLLALLTALSMLVACATQPASDPAAALGPWTSGRLSLKADASADRAAQSLSAAFELRGTANQGELRMLSPLGSVLAAARWQPGLVLLNTPQSVQRFADLQTLSRQVLGEEVPLAALPDWLAGRPWAGALHQPQPGGFEQLGWRVQTDRLAEGWVSARRDSAPAVQLRVRLDRPD